MFLLRSFAATTDEDWYQIFQINFMSGVRMARHYLPKMVERRWGRVVFVSSESAVNIPISSYKRTHKAPYTLLH